MTLSKIVPGLSLFAVLLAAPAARAQACAADADCPGGTTCQLLPTPSTAPTCGGPDCPVSTDQGNVAPPAPTSACAPAPCSVDADCGGGGRVCQHDKVTVCNGGAAPACARGETCDVAVKPETTTCVERTVSACVYRWQLPCRADADCGEGFTCAPNVSSTCSGTGPAGVADAGTRSSAEGPTATSEGGMAIALPAPNTGSDGGVPQDPMCTTTESFPGYCRARATTCTSDADCPSAWACTTGSVPPSRGGGTVGSGGTGGSGGSSGSGSATDAAERPAAEPGTTAPELVATAKVCQAPAAFPVRGAYATDSSLGGQQPTSGTPTGPGSGPEAAASGGGNAGCTVGGAATAPSLAGLLGLGWAVATVVGRMRRRR